MTKETPVTIELTIIEARALGFILDSGTTKVASREILRSLRQKQAMGVAIAQTKQKV